VVAAVIAQSHILRDQVRRAPKRGMCVRALLLDRTLGLFFCSISSAPWRAAA
jgi:hypothetical protein